MEQQKILTRIQLINWHYFENEQIAINGSALVSGENTAGKSTILDAIQLVLTTNTKKFNQAANEKSNRTLKGYVRCKIGNVGESYLRKNVVPANVALEFYEEKGNRYFVLGVHLTSQDEERPVIRKWYVQECRLEALSFMVGNRPSLAEEFRCQGKKISYIETDKAARDRFKRRLGNLEDKFFDIIPKSLAFKPMDNVKDFINKFVLSEEKIDVAHLRENIEILSEFEALLERAKRQYQELHQITDVHEKVLQKEHDISVNDILLTLANLEALKQEISDTEREIRLKKGAIESNKHQLLLLGEEKSNIEEQIVNINVAIQSNSSQKMLEGAARREIELKGKRSELAEQERSLKAILQNLKIYSSQLKQLDYELLDTQQFSILAGVGMRQSKLAIMEQLESFDRVQLDEIRKTYAKYQVEMENISNEIERLQENLKALEKQNLRFPEQTVALKEAIEKEFQRRGIFSKVYILAELVEITDVKWTNAIEAYLNQQKFYLVVEPDYYSCALEVYEKRKGQIHSVGIVNTRKLPMLDEVNPQSLAYVVKSENRYAKAYVNYLLGRVMRCEAAKDLEQYDIAITPECMLYQGYVVRHLNPGWYLNPYIGRFAYRVQITNTRKILEEKVTERGALRKIILAYNDVLDAAKNCNLTLLKLNIFVPDDLASVKTELAQVQAELEQAKKDPSLIELNIQLEERMKKKERAEGDVRRLDKETGRLEEQISKAEDDCVQKRGSIAGCKENLQAKEDACGLEYKEATDKYRNVRKNRTAREISNNYAPQRVQFENARDALVDEMKNLQMQFNAHFSEDFTIGLSGISEYRDAMKKLQTVEMIAYEEKLRQAKEDCEQIFKSDFLSRMKELIENAKLEFKNLNKALNDIYYGDDSYRFVITYDKHKEALYRMIVSENNQEGINLWTAAYEAEYKDEMEELFNKLMTKDDAGRKIVEEYTDYRSYLDYDIEIRKRDGSIQKFSDIYGEKSGSETQVPYYVAIAASFYQLYRYGNSVRLMLLDEAFDKMDDERIGSMMDFFNSLNLQVIMATPPAKIEVIGEKVGTILTAIRVGQNSIVEEYDL